ncbi:DUF4767 domain-containing protein [Latilactobacillus fragifolii]|nr:DUF4767 domain-containing protein [Latilactobacillus fragifolii]
MLMLLSACQKTQKVRELRRSSQSIQMKNSKKDKQVLDEESSFSKQEKELWSKDKMHKLATFMGNWGRSMGQTYAAYYPENNTDFYGKKYPQDFSKNQIAVANQQVSVAWSEDGNGTADYQVVAIYAEDSSANFGTAHLYLFSIHDDKPMVLITQQNQGMPDNLIHFDETKNATLKNGFSDIVNGVTPNQPTTTSDVTKESNTSSGKSSVAETTQREQANGNQPVSTDVIHTAEEAINYLKQQKGDDGWTVAHGSAGISSPVYWSISGQSGAYWIVYADGRVEPFK